MYETKECVLRLGKYSLVDRYYCFVSREYALHSVDRLLRQIKRTYYVYLVKVFESRLLCLESPENVEWIQVKECFEKQF